MFLAYLATYCFVDKFLWGSIIKLPSSLGQDYDNQ